VYYTLFNEHAMPLHLQNIVLSRLQYVHFWLFVFRKSRPQPAVIHWKKWKEFFLKVD